MEKDKKIVEEIRALYSEMEQEIDKVSSHCADIITIINNVQNGDRREMLFSVVMFMLVDNVRVSDETIVALLELIKTQILVNNITYSNRIFKSLVRKMKEGEM